MLLSGPNMAFIHDDFLLTNKHAALSLRPLTRAHEPILDYHCHLPPADVAANRQFANLFEIWLEGDHYKWRAMRANGVDERFCTGDAPPLREVPGLGPHRAAHPAQSALSLDPSGTAALLRHRRTARRIDAPCASGSRPTTSSPPTNCARTAFCASFHVQRRLHHRRPRRRSGRTTKPSPHPASHTKVFPTFRPDKALTVHLPEAFNPWMARLEAVSNTQRRQFLSTSSTRSNRATISSTRWAAASPTTA